ncbi:MAG: hypothetical protein LVQ95_03070 [Candidatus Micrarchaeales archaeon]|nr:hypothetical protein [Candidatus Micrarchaeales archaeon]
MPNNEKYQVIEREYVLSEKIDATPEVLVARFKSEDGKPWPFDPGMFMMISGIDAEGKKHVARAFSISSDPSAREIEFFIVKEPRHPKIVGQPAVAGAASATPPAASAAGPANAFPEPQYTHFMNAKIGDLFVLKGPSGQFRFDPEKDPKVLFIAGGTGLAPFMSMLRHMKVTGSMPDVKVIYSIKYPSEIILKDELEQLILDIGAKLDITVTRPEPGDSWAGLTGHVTAEMIEKCSPDCRDRMIYICGPLPFVQAVKTGLSSLGIPPQRISADVWG